MQSAPTLSSVAKKALMAVTGLMLVGFVLAHMLGNLQIFLGQDAINSYAEHLQGLGPLLWVARGILLAVLVTHIAVAANLAAANRAARPAPYRKDATVQASYASRTMMMSGLIVFTFLVYHLAHFTFGSVHPELFHLSDAKGRHDVYSMVVSSYRNDWVVAAYVLAMVPLSLHLSHGFQSLFQSLGADHARFTPWIRWAARCIGMAVLIGNSSIPLAARFGLLRLPGAVGS